jgi:membrane fusion protein, multidrug efflux system
MKKILAAIALVALGILLGVSAIPLSKRFSAPAVGAAAPASPAATTAATEFATADLLTLAAQDIEKQITLTGSLKAANQTIVKSKSAGEIREILVREGSIVKKGQLLAKIDPTEADLRVREREALLRQAQASLDQATRAFNNNKALVEQNFISKTALDNSRAQLDAAVSAKEAALANLTLARRALADTLVSAPINGTIGERFAQPGEKVSPDNRILSIMDLSRMELEASVPATDVAKLSLGQMVSLNVEGMTQVQRGELVRISPATSTGSRSVPVFIALGTTDSRLRAGLFAQASLTTEKKTGVKAVPLSAIRDNGGRTFVYLVKSGKLEERLVTLGLRDDNARASNGATGMVEILQGLEFGDSIVAANLGILRVGSTVTVGRK